MQWAWCVPRADAGGVCSPLHSPPRRCRRQGKKFREEHEARSERRKIEAKAKKAEAKAKAKAKAKAEQPGDSKGELDHGNGQAVTPGSVRALGFGLCAHP